MEVFGFGKSQVARLETELEREAGLKNESFKYSCWMLQRLQSCLHVQ